MTLAAQIAWDDTVLPFQLDRSDIRGRVARLDTTIDTILRQHDYPLPVAGLVAEVAMLTVLIGQSIKLRWKLSVQVRGDGPVRLITADYRAPDREGAPAEMRAYAGIDRDAVDPRQSGFAQLGTAVFGLVIDQGPGTAPYQGITPVTGGSLAASAEAYFAQSEQLPTRFVLAAAEAQAGHKAPSWRAGGIMLQLMPKVAAVQGDAPPDGLMSATDLLGGDDEEHWQRAMALIDTAELEELLGPEVASDQLLVRLFHEEAPRVFDAAQVAFGCTCSADKVRQTMSIYSAKDIARMTTEAGEVVAECQFCGRTYRFDPGSLGFEAEG